jgi:glutathione S-transferase
MLEELGVEYVHVKTHFIGECKTPEFLKINPNGHIPALEDDGLVLFESLAINLHLARKYGGGLWPEDFDDQSRAIQWSIWAATELEPPLMQVLLNRIFLPESQRKPERAARGVENLRKPVKILDDALEGRETILDGEFSVADLNLHGVLYWGRRLGGIDFSETPRVDAWLDRIAARPAFSRVDAL